MTTRELAEKLFLIWFEREGMDPLDADRPDGPTKADADSGLMAELCCWWAEDAVKIFDREGAAWKAEEEGGAK